MPKNIYRYPSGCVLTTAVRDFARDHMDDKLAVYRQEWGRWCTDNAALLSGEAARLTVLGYEKCSRECKHTTLTECIEHKMFTAGRYYHRKVGKGTLRPPKESCEAPAPVAKVRLSKAVLDDIDAFIGVVLEGGQPRPQEVWCRYQTERAGALAAEAQRITGESGIDHSGAVDRVGRTLKNRYYSARRGA